MIVVPVYNIILAPGASIYMGIDQIKKTSGGKEIAPGERVVLIVAKENRSFNELDENSFYPVGVSASITEVNRQGFVLMNSFDLSLSSSPMASALHCLQCLIIFTSWGFEIELDD